MVGILMISLRGNKVGGRRWMRCGQNGRAGWSREFLRPLSSYSSLQLWRNYPQAQLGPLFVGDHGNFKKIMLQNQLDDMREAFQYYFADFFVKGAGNGYPPIPPLYFTKETGNWSV